MTKGDATVEHAADRLDELADNAAASGGLKARLAGELADDAAFLRKLKPSLVVARARGKREAAAPQAAQLPPRPKPRRPSAGGGPNPFVVMAAALAAGVALAKWLDWRGHAHPRG